MIASKRERGAAALVAALAIALAAPVADAAGSAVKLHATVVGAPNEGPLTIEVSRWSTDDERAPLLAALAPLPPARASNPPAAGAAGRGRAGRGGRGAAAPPADPLTRLTAAIRGAPTVGYVWTSGITGFSIRYAWRAPAADVGERIVLVTDRRLGANSPGWPAPSGGPADAEFTVLEMHLATTGAGEARSSLNSSVVVDDTARTLALASYASAPPFLKVTR